MKKDAVFAMFLPNEQVVNLWGDMLLYKGSERTKTKYKERGPLDLY